MPFKEKAKQLISRYVCTGTLWKMKDRFQLSIELYDAKNKKVMWSDRWQEKWDNLPSIKANLSDGLLKALDTRPKVEMNTNVPIANAKKNDRQQSVNAIVCCFSTFSILGSVVTEATNTSSLMSVMGAFSPVKLPE